MDQSVPLHHNSSSPGVLEETPYLSGSPIADESSLSLSTEVLHSQSPSGLRNRPSGESGVRSDSPNGTSPGQTSGGLDYTTSALHLAVEEKRDTDQFLQSLSQDGPPGDPSSMLSQVRDTGLDVVENLPLELVVNSQSRGIHHHHHHHEDNQNHINRRSIDLNPLISPYLVKHEIDNDLGMRTVDQQHQSRQQLQQQIPSPGSNPSVPPGHLGMADALLQQQLNHHHHLHAGTSAAAAVAAAGMHQHHSHLPHSMMQSHVPHLQHSHHQLLQAHEFAAAAAAAAAGSDPRHMHYGSGLGSGPPDCLTTQKAVAFLAGPRERIHVLGNPVEHCPRCQQEGLGTTGWRPHRHIGELKIRYICERHFDDLESNHHFDIPLCPICNQVLYLYDFNNMLGVSNARRLHKYVLKCANRHVLPLLDLFCQTKKGGERCNANFKLQWCYGTMVKRCEAQKNRDHDLWWVRYKNEWKQRRTIIRYKKDFLSHLTDAQRSLLLGLGLEGEPPPDPKTALGPTFDALVSSAGGSPSGPKIKKRPVERHGGLGHLGVGMGGIEAYDLNPSKRRFRSSDFGMPGDLSGGRMSGNHQSLMSGPNMHLSHHHHRQDTGNLSGDAVGHRRMSRDAGDLSDPLRHMLGAVVVPTNRTPEDPQVMLYLQQQQQWQQQQQQQSQSSINGYNIQHPQQQQQQQFGNSDAAALLGIPPHLIITGTPTPPLNNSDGPSPVAVSVIGEVLQTSVVQ